MYMYMYMEPARGSACKFSIPYHVWCNVSDWEGVFPVGGAYHTLILPGRQDAGLDHEPKLGGQCKIFVVGRRMGLWL